MTDAFQDFAGDSRWVAWRNESRNDKTTKVPYGARGRRAKSNDPATWINRAEAEMRAGNLVNGQGGGIGIQLGELDGTARSLAGVDLDTCIAADGSLAPWAERILAELPTYAETSPSGTGVKAFFLIEGEHIRPFLDSIGAAETGWGIKRGIAGSNRQDHAPGVEIYASHRYFAITGKLFPGASPDIRFLDTDQLQRLARALPQKQTGTGKGKGKGRDRSRSALAWRLGTKMQREGKTFEEFVEAALADPETAEWARTKGVADNGRELRRIWERVDPAYNAIAVTEDAAALNFVEKYRDQLRFCHETGSWFQWNGQIWHIEKTALAFEWCRQICREEVAGLEKPPRAFCQARTAAGVERFARADRAFAVTAALWDKDPFLLGTPAGTVELRRGVLRGAQQTDYITKSTLVAPAERADCPIWLKFLGEATHGDAPFIRFLRQWCGYTLTGDIREHALLFIFGSGGNGKGVFLNTVSRIFGDYATIAAMDTFVAAKNERHPTDLAMLRGARLVYVSETEEGHAWAESRIKSLTGGDPITARFMRQDFFTYWPQFKITIIGNHKPVLRNVDDAARRRFNLAPFNFKPEKVDHQLSEKLEPEYPAILRWIIDGALDWQKNGLTRPPVVHGATSEYFADQDTVRQWIEACCEVTTAPPHIADTCASLFASWQNYATHYGEAAGSARAFADKLRALGYQSIKDTLGIRGRGFAGIKVHVSSYCDFYDADAQRE